jgi:hypothetical protein
MPGARIEAVCRSGVGRPCNVFAWARRLLQRPSPNSARTKVERDQCQSPNTHACVAKSACSCLHAHVHTHTHTHTHTYTP